MVGYNGYAVRHSVGHPAGGRSTERPYVRRLFGVYSAFIWHFDAGLCDFILAYKKERQAGAFAGPLAARSGGTVCCQTVVMSSLSGHALVEVLADGFEELL